MNQLLNRVRRPYTGGKIVAVISAMLMPLAASAQPTTLQIHPSNARVTFTVGHLLGSVDGSFDSFRGRVVYDPKHPEGGRVEWEVNVRSVNTNSHARDEHLQTADYFYTDHYPTLSFASQSVHASDPRHLAVTGRFTMRGVSKTITVPAVLSDKGFDVNFSLLRSDYKFTGGRPGVGDKVDIHLHLNSSSGWFPGS
jgi:polyisoprenoid-binding protein YceI